MLVLLTLLHLSGLLAQSDGEIASLQAFNRACVGWPPSWNVSDHPCNWFGVNCFMGENGQRLVLSLNIRQYHVVCPQLPSTMWNLPNMTLIELGFNQIAGTLPDEVSQMEHMAAIKFASSNLTGSLPSTLIKMPLTELGISNSRLNGTIPPLPYSTLKVLDLSQSQLTGTLPDIPAGSPLTRINLQDCRFTGTIPASWASLASTLVSVNLGNNQLEGSVPAWLENVAKNGKNSLNLGNNKFTGPCPKPDWLTGVVSCPGSPANDGGNGNGNGDRNNGNNGRFVLIGALFVLLVVGVASVTPWGRAKWRFFYDYAKSKGFVFRKLNEPEDI